MESEAAADPQSPSAVGRILIVEDERVVARLLGSELTNFGYTVVGSVTNGKDAVAQALSLTPDLILMDIYLPGPMDGIEATAQIKKSADIPVIYMSACPDEKNQQRVSDTHPHAYLVKPFKPAELRCAIEIALHRSEIGAHLHKHECWLLTTLRSIGAALVGKETEDSAEPLNPVARALRGWPAETSLDKTIDELLRLVGEVSDSQPSVEGPALDPLQAGKGTWLAPTPTLAPKREVAPHHLAEEIRELNLNLERRVLERTEQLEAANRELDSFNASVAHDLRAPLRGIEGFSQALIENHAEHLGPDGVDKLTRIRAATARMTGLIDGLLRLSRVARSEIHKDSVSLSALANAVVVELQTRHPDRSVEFVVAEGMTVQGDEPLLRILMQNLLENAWKFSSKVAAARIEVGQISAEGAQTCFVRDNGAGFDMNKSQKLFGAFQRMHGEREFEGTGVGLAIVQRIVDRHGGLIWAESAIGQGTTFYFTI